jgi:hypothetical protein
VAFAAPLKVTTDPFINPVPVTVNVKALEPAVALDGESFVIAGTGLPAAVIVKGSVFDVPPPGAAFVTLTSGDPALAMSVARIAAVTCVALT